MKNKMIIIILVMIFWVIAIYFDGKLFNNVKYIIETNRILSDDLEIEKKWLIDFANIPYNLAKADIEKIEQTYICFSPEIRVRRINDGQRYTFTVKTGITEDGMIRNELEEEITKEEYENMIIKKEGNTINKTRYQIFDNGYVYAIDIFSGDLTGLAYLEVEFKNEDEAHNFMAPDWVKKDVTADLNYKNGYLARFGIPDTFEEYMK